MKRVTIIGDDAVTYRMVKEIRDLGATGYTLYVVQGDGQSGVRPRHAEPPNAKIEVIADPELAQRILEHVAQQYFTKYAMIAYLENVEVLRGQKFGAKDPAENSEKETSVSGRHFR